MPKGYFLSAHRSPADPEKRAAYLELAGPAMLKAGGKVLASTSDICLLYTSPSPRDLWISRMPSSA